MKVQLRTTLAVVFLVGVPLSLRAAPANASGILTAKEVRKAEAEPKTAADHGRLAAFYQIQAQQWQKKSSEEEEMANSWSWMAGRTKVPNPYSTAASLVQTYRAEWQRNSTLAANHERIAESLRSSAGGAGQ